MLTRCCAATLLLALLTGCGDDSGSASDRPAPASSSADSVIGTPTPTTDGPMPTASATAMPARRGTRVVVADSEFGPMLFGGNGRAIYLFDVETTSKPRCYDVCAEAWPPVLTRGEPVAGPGVDGSLLATTERRDGTVQITYGDHPLYFYANEAPGEVECHDVFLNGGGWYVVQPGGDAAPPG